MKEIFLYIFLKYYKSPLRRLTGKIDSINKNPNPWLNLQAEERLNGII